MLSDESIIFELNREIKTGPYAHMKFYEKFWNSVEILSENECWIFSGKIYKNGYGCFRINCHDFLAHKISWLLSYGKKIDGLVIMHSCNNRLCVNPNHLSMGTYSENLQYMVKCGRNNPPRGERNHRYKITEKDVKDIRLYSMAGIAPYVIAKIFDISKPQTYRIINGKRRK